MWRFRVTTVGIDFWVCRSCVIEEEPQIISISVPSTHYDLDKVLGRK